MLLLIVNTGNGDYSTASGNTEQFNSNNVARENCLGFPEILDDDFVEDGEDFTVQLNSNGFADVLNTSDTLVVTIEDNDGT